MTSASSAGDSKSSHSHHRLFALGVDGGGTKTLAWIGTPREDGQFKIVGKGSAASSNQVAVGVDTAFANLGKAVEEACEAANISTDQLGVGVFALAGSGNELGRQRILEFTHKHLQIPSSEVVHDGQAVLQAGTPEGWGIALIAGTGAVAYGTNRAGETGVVGGWGYWFGDEGSAYWLGRKALRAIAHATDGRGAQTKLTEQILARLKVEDPRELLSAMNRQGDIRSSIASLADLVCDLAEHQDDVARSILDQAAQHWVDHVATLRKTLAISEPAPLALAGGVLCGSEFAREKLTECLEAEQVQATSLTLVSEPVEGCVKLACRKIEASGQSEVGT